MSVKGATLFAAIFVAIGLLMTVLYPTVIVPWMTTLREQYGYTYSQTASIYNSYRVLQSILPKVGLLTFFIVLQSNQGRQS